MKKLIGISGLIGSGKDTIANHLITHHNYEKYSWARPLKDITATLFGWDRDMLEGTTPESRTERDIPDEWWSSKMGKPWSPRYALQQLGTDVLRKNLHDDIWILAGMKHIETMEYVVIPDTRFPNEIAAIKSMGGEVWHVHRGDFPEWWDRLSYFKKIYNPTPERVSNFMAIQYPSVHSSEYSWHGTEFDQVISNDGTIDELSTKVNSILPL